ncbi:hypothetical protein ACFV6F_26790 [Kitasatospora phosalacinea]|uniref:hypothetical protein n=1 Tax=Kitasatospora phosalacinea TaxID=2065 RepID=UPI00364EBA61
MARTREPAGPYGERGRGTGGPGPQPAVPRHRRTVLEAQRFADRFRHLTAARVARDVARAARLRTADPPAPVVPDRDRKVIVSMTTVPERLPLIGPALRSLLDQSCPADRIVLALPHLSVRGTAAYPAPRALPGAVEVLRCEDHGPATKLLPVLAAEPEAVIVAVDDDVVYPRDFLQCLLTWHERCPDTAVGLRGWRRDPVWPRHVFGTGIAAPVEVDVLMGTWGYLVPPGAFDAAVHDFTAWPPATRWADDIWFSGHLARLRVDRLVVPGAGLPLETRASWTASLSQGLNRSGANDRAALDAFAAFWRT